jgi:hypothetical protein
VTRPSAVPVAAREKTDADKFGSGEFTRACRKSEGVPIVVESLRAAVGTFYYATSRRVTDFDPLRIASNIQRSR